MHVCKHTYTKADIYTQTIANTQTQHILGRNNVSTEVCHSVCICVCMSMRMHTNTIPAADTIESAPMTVSTGPQYSVISGFKPFVCAKPQIKWEIVARSNTLPAPPVLTICHNMSWYVLIFLFPDLPCSWILTDICVYTLMCVYAGVSQLAGDGSNEPIYHPVQFANNRGLPSVLKYRAPFSSYGALSRICRVLLGTWVLSFSKGSMTLIHTNKSHAHTYNCSCSHALSLTYSSPRMLSLGLSLSRS